MIAEGFGFNASASVFGGLVKSAKNRQQSLKAAPSVALSPTGGDVQRRRSRYSKDDISFSDSYTRVRGIVSEGKRETIVELGLKDLDIFGRVQATSIEARLISRHAMDQRDSNFTIEANFEGLVVDGKRVSPELDCELFQLHVPTYSEFVAFFSDPENLKVYAPKFGWIRKTGERDHETIETFAPVYSTEPIRCSLMTNRVDDKPATFVQEGYSLILEDNSVIHLAEVLVKPGLRRLNMLRVESLRKPAHMPQAVVRAAQKMARLDSEDALAAATATYNATVCSGEGNGASSYPP